MLRHKNLFARLAVLAVLLSCLVVVAFTPNTQPVLAAPCCESCPIPPGEVEPSPQDYCTNQCGASSGSCYNSCISSVYNCWRNCRSCSGGGGGGGGEACPGGCPIGYFCAADNTCTPL